MQKFGIDVSAWQGNFNLMDAIKEGCQYTIIKIGGADGRLYKAEKFDFFYAQCEQYSLPKGCYFYGHAMTVEQAKKEAEYWLSLMEGYKFDYPVFYDFEADMLKLDKRTLTNIIKCVCEIVESHGYWVGVYTSRSHFDVNVYDNELSRYSHWVAAHGTKKPKLARGGETQMWQFGGNLNHIRSCKINGTVVDQNYCYVDFPTLIKKKGLNGYSNHETTRKTNNEIAREVISGLWGNGIVRRTRLTLAGYNATEIQKLVNQMLAKK